MGQPAVELAPVAAHDGEAEELPGDPHLDIRRAVGALRPRHCCADVVVLGIEARKPGRLAASPELEVGPLDGRRRELRVPPPHGVFLAGLGEALERVLAHRLEQHEPADARDGADGAHEVALDERLQDVDGSGTVELFGRADAQRRFQREAAGEHRQAPEQDALGGGEQLVAPVERGAQRLVT